LADEDFVLLKKNWGILSLKTRALDAKKVALFLLIDEKEQSKLKIVSDFIFNYKISL